MGLYEQIMEDYKQAMREKKQLDKEILNFLIAQLKNKKIDLQKDLIDDDIIGVIKKEIKTRKESIEYMEKLGNSDDVKVENAKISIIEKYLPQMLSEEELANIIKDKISELGIEDLQKQRGMLIGAIMKDYKPVVDGSMMNQIINNLN